MFRELWPLLALALACKAKDPPPLPVARAVPAPAASAPAKPDNCSAHGYWFGNPGPVEGTFEERRAKAVAMIATWTPECRWASHMEECERGCDDMLSGMLIDAAPDVTEKRRILQWRHDRNAEQVTVWRTYEKRAAELVSYASKIRNSPRASAYASGTSLEARASDLASGNPCLTRMKADFARISAFAADLEREGAMLGLNAISLRGLTFNVRSCVDCSDDRSLCNDMATDLKTYRENLTEQAKLVAGDEALMRRLAK